MVSVFFKPKTTLIFPLALLAASALVANDNDYLAEGAVVNMNEMEVLGHRDTFSVDPAVKLDTEAVKSLSPINNNALLRLLPGVNGGLDNKDRFGGPTSIRGGITWGIVETVDGYPSVDIVAVAAEDGGYTANLSTIIPSIALTSMSVATEGLGVNYGQATGGVIRSQIKRGSANEPYSAVQGEYNTVGEVIGMGEYSGGSGKLDFYAAVQTVQGDYGDKYETHSRPLETTELYSALMKMGYTVAPGQRFELLAVAGDEEHHYYQFSSGNRTNYKTEKDNLFVGVRFDHNTDGPVRWDAGATLTDFHENRINKDSGLSERNRPQKALKGFANIYHDHDLSEDWHWSASHGLEVTDDYFSDITGATKRFDFGELAAYTRHSAIWQKKLTLVLGLRAAQLDNGFSKDDHLLYNLGASYKLPTDTVIHASHSTGYRLNKAFYLFWGGGANILRDPATGLDPSESETTEFGFTQPFMIAGGEAEFRATYYESTESRLFNFGNTGTGTPYYDEGIAQGVELWLDWNPSSSLHLFAGYGKNSNERHNSSNPNSSNVGLRFSPLPEDTFSAGMTWKARSNWEVSLAGLYDSGAVREFYDNGLKETEQFGAFFKVDAAIARRVTPSLVAYLRVENLLNERDLGYTSIREESDGTTTANNATQQDPGILFSLGARWEF